MSTTISATGYLQLLRERPQFRYLWLAALVSMMGDWFNTIASVILVNRYTDSGLAVGALFLARMLPPFLLGPVAGVVADRFNRRAILIITDVSRALVVLGFLLVDSPERAWLIYVLSVAQFAISAFFEPARSAILPSLLRNSQEILGANTLTSSTWSAMLALGAALGGVMAAVFGVRTALIVDAATFLLSGLFILQIGKPAPRAATEYTTSGWRDFVDGLQYIRSHPHTGLLTLVKGLGQIGSPDIMIAVYAEQVFPLGDEGALALGLLFAFAGVGAILGPILGNALTDGSARALQGAIGVGFMFIAGGWLLFGLAPILPVALLAMTVRHLGGSANWTYSTVLLQTRTPDRFLGRVFAIDFGFFTLAASLSVWFTGVALDRTAASPRDVSLFLALASVLPVISWFAYRRRAARSPGEAQAPAE